MKKYFGFAIPVIVGLVLMIYPMINTVSGKEQAYTIVGFYVLYQIAVLIGAMMMKGSEFSYKIVFVLVSGLLALLAPLVVLHSFNYIPGLVAVVVAIVAQIVSGLAFKSE